MPEELFSKYKDIVKITTYEGMKDVLGEDPRKAYKRMFIQETNKKQRLIYTQLPDGQVLSFEQFKQIKDNIVRSNSGV